MNCLDMKNDFNIGTCISPTIIANNSQITRQDELFLPEAALVRYLVKAMKVETAMMPSHYG